MARIASIQFLAFCPGLVVLYGLRMGLGCHSRTNLFPSDDNEAEMQEPAQEEEEENGDDDSDSDSATVVTEIRFVPSDKTACE